MNGNSVSDVEIIKNFFRQEGGTTCLAAIFRTLGQPGVPSDSVRGMYDYGRMSVCSDLIILATEGEEGGFERISNG